MTRKFRKKYLICFFSMFIYSRAYPEILNWQQVLESALAENPSLAASRESLRQYEISYKSSYLNYYPDLSGSAGLRKSDSGDPSLSLGLSSRLSVFNGFKNSTEVKRKKTNLTLQETLYKRKLSDFIYNLRISYAQVLKLKDTLRLLSEIENRRKNNLELVQLRYDAGREDKGAFLRSEADYLQSKYETKSEKRKFTLVKAELLKNIGKNIYDVIEVTGTFAVSQDISKPEKESVYSNPDYLAYKYRQQISAYDLEYKYGDFYPDIGFSGSLSRSGRILPLSDSSWSVGLSLSYPFFSGGRDLYELESAKLSKDISGKELENAEHEIALQIEKAYNDLIDSIEYLEVSEKYYTARKERSVISREKYINGLISYQDWDSIENEFISTQKSMIESRYNVFANWAKWLKTIGEEE